MEHQMSDSCSGCGREYGRKKLFNSFPFCFAGGASLDLNSVKAKPFNWIPDVTWLSVVQLSHLPTFSNIIEEVSSYHIQLFVIRV